VSMRGSKRVLLLMMMMKMEQWRGIWFETGRPIPTEPADLLCPVKRKIKKKM
jgi:hypothetical protein